MSAYKVWITESRTYSVEVEADSEIEAEEKAQAIPGLELPEIGGIYETTFSATLLSEVSGASSR